MKQLEVSGTITEYSQIGEGPGLLLIHGTSVDGAGNFGQAASRFADIRTVVLPNHSGAGASTIPAGPLEVATSVAQIAGIISDLGGAPVDLVGDSLGAVVAAATAARHPSLVRRLVLVAGWVTSAPARHQLVFATWARLQRTDPELGNRYMLSLALTPEFLESMGPTALGEALAQPMPSRTLERIDLGLRIDIEQDLARVSMPTLVVAGVHDQIIPAYQTEHLHAAIPGSRYATVDSGHAAFVEQPDALVELIRAFLLEG